MKIRWPRLTFPPINLWNAPRQWAWGDRMTMDNDQPSWQELKDERDALAVYVERCREEFAILSEYWNGGEGMAAENAAQNAMDVACDMLEELPETSLARLKAEWQADGAQLTADSIRYEYEGEIHQDRIADHADEVAEQLRRQAVRTMEMNDNCPWRNRLDELLYQLAETIPNLNEPDYYKNELIDRVNELRRQAEEVSDENAR